MSAVHIAWVHMCPASDFPYYTILKINGWLCGGWLKYFKVSGQERTWGLDNIYSTYWHLWHIPLSGLSPLLRMLQTFAEKLWILCGVCIKNGQKQLRSEKKADVFAVSCVCAALISALMLPCLEDAYFAQRDFLQCSLPYLQRGAKKKEEK